MTKRHALIITISVMAMIINLIAMTSLAMAKDMVMKGKEVKSVTVAYTKTANNEYVRINIKEPRELDGVKYNASVAVMVFDETLLEEAKSLAPGAMLNCIADQGTYKGRNSYTVLAFIE